jgi:hypothetical protein
MKEEKARIKYILEYKQKMDLEKLEIFRKEQREKFLLKFIEYPDKCYDLHVFLFKMS